MSRPYYSQRQGRGTIQKYDLKTAQKLIMSIFRHFETEGYFQESFGYTCVDAGYVSGSIGDDIKSFFIRKIKRINLWPLTPNKLKSWTQDDLFDFIEITFDCISRPKKEGAYHHSFSDCGWHFSYFEKENGQYEYSQEINEVLKDFLDGYELTANGEIISLPEEGFEHLIKKAEIPVTTPQSVAEKIEYAKVKFFRYKSTIQERQEAVRILADCFESIKPSLTKVLTNKDESDLFNIANNFGIRHHNEKQKTQYDKDIWFSWMFYFYLATLHAALRLIDRKKSK